MPPDAQLVHDLSVAPKIPIKPMAAKATVGIHKPVPLLSPTSTYEAVYFLAQFFDGTAPGAERSAIRRLMASVGDLLADKMDPRERAVVVYEITGKEEQ